MRKVKIKFILMLALPAALFGFTWRSGGIQGKITPATHLEKVLAVMGKDTLIAEINKGKISFKNIKTGTYLLLIKAKAPYKDTSVENVAVIDSTITDIGEIALEQ
jgi:hypothetical protein